MTSPKPSERPYAPFPMHRFYDWLDRLPIPMWLFYPLLLLLLGLALQVLAWSGGIVPVGQFSFFTLFAFIWLVETLALAHYAHSVSGPLLDGYRAQLPVNDREYARLRYEFSRIPSNPGSLFFLLGAAGGIFTAFSVMQSSPTGLQNMFPALTVVQWAFSFGLSFTFMYFIIRQLRMISRLFVMTERVQINNLAPIYAFSRYTAIIGFGIFMISNVNAILFAPNNFENAYAAFSSYFFIGFILAIFYIPMRGINQRLIAEKEHLLGGVIGRIEETFERIHTAHDEKNYKNTLGLRNMLAALKDEKELIESVPTWPWKPGTFAALLSALFLPTILSLISLVLENFLNL